MVQAVDHGVATSTVTTAAEATKGAVKGALAPILVGAAVLGLLAFGLASMASGGGIAAALGAISPAGWVGIAGGAVGAALGAALMIPGAIIGGVLGFGKGQKRVGAEQTKFDREQDLHTGRLAARSGVIQDQMMQAAQMGYAKGAQDTEQLIRQQLEQARYAQIQQEMQKQAAQQHHAAAATGKSNCAPCGQHTAAEMQRREAAAATPNMRA